MADPFTWKKYPVKIKRFKDTHQAAKEFIQGVLNHGSHYETETNFGKGHRIKKKKKIESDSEEEPPSKRPVRGSTKPIPPPPTIPLPKTVLETVSHHSMKRREKNIKVHEAKTLVTKTKMINSLSSQRTNNRSVPTGSAQGKDLETSLFSALKSNTKGTEHPKAISSLQRASSSSVTGSASHSAQARDTETSLFSALKNNKKETEHPKAISPPLRASSSSVTGSASGSAQGRDTKTSLFSALKNKNKGTEHPKSISPPLRASSNPVIGFTPSDDDDETTLDPFSSLKTTLRKSESPEQAQSPRQKSSFVAEGASINDHASPLSSLHKKRSSLHTPEQSKSSSISGITALSAAPLSSSRESFSFSETEGNDDNNNIVENPGSGTSQNSSSIAEGIDARTLHTPDVSTHKAADPKTQKENLKKMQWMEKDIASIKEEMRLMRGDLQTANLNIARLLRFLMPHEKKLKLPPNLPTPTLHLSTLAEFKEMEAFLADKVNFDAVVEYLGLVPVGPKENNAAMTLMGKVMSNGLASGFNFEGNGWKLPFKGTYLWKAVEGALSLHFKGSTLEAALAGVRSWLRNAPKRDGGKPPSFFQK